MRAWSVGNTVGLSSDAQFVSKPMSIESLMTSNHLILCHPLLLLPSIPPSIRVFSNESALRIRWPNYWSFSFNINLSNEHSGLISFRMDWLDLLAVQGTLKCLLQHHSSKASVLQHHNSNGCLSCGTDGKESAWNARKRPRFNPCIWKIP